MIHENCNMAEPKKKEKSKAEQWLFYAGLFVLGLFAGVALSCAVLIGTAGAEGDIEYDCWAMCQPGDYINVRQKPGKHTEITGWAVSGMRFRTDGEERNGYIHLIGVTEYGEGWISESYIVYSEPREVNREMTIREGGRVACRKTISGKRRGWAKSGETVTVYWIGGGWAVTDRGFIQSKYLED